MQTVEERTGKMPKALKAVVKLEDIPGSEMEKRALEVALAGGHSMAILYNAGSYAPQLIQTGKRMAQEASDAAKEAIPYHGIAYPWCPCGNYGSPKQECCCSAKVIEKHLIKLGKRTNDFAIWIGASIPLAREISRKGEPEAIIIKRIQAARAIPEPSDVLDSCSKELIECYMSQVNAALDLSKMIAVAKTIARLDGQDRIQVQHVTEAMQYQPYFLHGFSGWIKPKVVEVRLKP